jgi:hypothetical protein
MAAMRLRFLSLVALVAPFAAAGCDFSMHTSTSVSASAPPAPPPPSPLAGWTLAGAARQGYVAEVDPNVMRDGHSTIAVRPHGETGSGYLSYMTALDAGQFRGRRVRAEVWVRTQAVTERGDFWIRAQAAGSPPDGTGVASAMQALAPTADFTRYELTINVPESTSKLEVGVGLAGPGMLWMDGLRLEGR